MITQFSINLSIQRNREYTSNLVTNSFSSRTVNLTPVNPPNYTFTQDTQVLGNSRQVENHLRKINKLPILTKPFFTVGQNDV